ncbi:MAG: glycosyltransferase family 39 protein [Chthonomonadales bacterium]|nr:glycosyltransferase family 39 protein [Chthonomonadales bacterium]
MGLLSILAFVWRLGSPGLFDFNEGLYVQAAREMAIRHDWITGTVNGVPFYDKPPLALWCAVLSFMLFGFTEFAARFPVALAGIGMTVLTYALGRAIFGRSAARFAAAFVALNPMALGTARQMTMDIHQSFWVASAMAAFYAAERSQGRKQILFALTFCASCGLGFMAKSFPGLLPLVIVGIYVAIVTRLRFAELTRYARALRPILGMAILAVVVAPWHIAAYQRSGAFFVAEYWTHHHVGLLKATEFDHAQPLWYYIPMLLIGFFPWGFLLPFSDVTRATLRVSDDAARGRLLILLWAAVTFLAFTAMRSKLISYLLPMYPACAILAASAVARQASPRRARVMAAVWGLIGLALIAALAIVHWRLLPMARETTDPEALALITPEMTRVAYLIPATLGAALLAAAVAGWRDSRRGAAWAVGGMAAFTFIAWEVGVPAYDRAVNMPLRHIAAEAGARFDRDTPLVVHIGRPRRPSVFFYLPDYTFHRLLVPNRRDPILLETWDSEPVRAFVAGHRSVYILADHNHGMETLASIPSARVVLRSARWTLFHVLAPAGARPPHQPAGRSSR